MWPWLDNPMLLGIAHQNVTEYPGCFTTPSEVHQEVPSMPPHRGYRHTQHSLSPTTLEHTVFGGTLSSPVTGGKQKQTVRPSWLSLGKAAVQPLYKFLPSQKPQHLHQMQPRVCNPRARSRFLNSHLWLLTPEWLPLSYAWSMASSPAAQVTHWQALWVLSPDFSCLVPRTDSLAFICLVPRQPSLGSTRLCAVRACFPQHSAALTQRGPQCCLQGERPSLQHLYLTSAHLPFSSSSGSPHLQS